MPSKANREADMQHRIEELEEQLKAAKASVGARASLREFIAKHPSLTHLDVSMVAAEMRAPGRFKQASNMATPVKLAVGKALREARKAKGWSGTEAAEKVGVHNASISGWERGNNMPTEAHHAAIKRVLGVDVAALAKKAANGAATAH